MAGEGRVAVVTDSTAYLPVGLAQRYGVSVVPVHVVLDGKAGDEGVDVSPADVAAALQRRASVTTSRPSPAEFATAYAAARAAGAGAVVSVHLSGSMSGTVASARAAAADAAYDVQVVDSRTLCMGLGFAVLAAASAAASGASAEKVAQVAAVTAAGTRTLFYVSTLDHLRRGGRIGAASALLGTALAVKPLLHVAAGEVALLERVRTATRAMARLEELAVEAAAGQAVDLAVHHLAAGEAAAALTQRLRAAVPSARSLYLSEVGAVVGAHTGPGLLGIVVSRR
ncbi:MAG: DegV family protein [Mycobacteriales bacterium]